MGPMEILRFAIRGVTANKMRSGLTMLGIMIGVGAVIVLVAVGNGSAKSVQDRLEALGTKTITVMSTGQSSGGHNGALTVSIAKALEDRSLAPHVKTVSPVVSANSATMTYGSGDHAVNQFVGTYPSYFGAESYQLAQGSLFNQEDVNSGRRVVVIGQTVAEELFGGTDPINQQVTVSGSLFTVVGVLAEQSSTGFQDSNDVAIAPLTAVQQTLAGFGSLNQIIIEATSSDAVDTAETEVSSILDNLLHVSGSSGGSSSGGFFPFGGGSGSGSGSEGSPYRIQNASQLLSTQESTSKTFTVLLGAVAGISLLVGGIGITNIMLVTVTERTREIGIRKALGAPKRTIMTQFLAEATMLSVIGGALGVAGGLIGSQFKIVGIQPVVATYSIVLAFGVSVAIGLFFGSYPASRAAGLRPIDALRYE